MILLAIKHNGLKTTQASEGVPVIKKALNLKKPVIMDFVVEQEVGVDPMVPAGAARDEMILL